MTRHRLAKISLGMLGALLLFGGVVGAAIFFQIQRAVRQECVRALAAHPGAGDEVSALIAFMNSPGHAWPERNRAVWALGRLADPAALPALASAYVGSPCDHDHALCQYELEKALKRCGGELPQARVGASEQTLDSLRKETLKHP